MNEVWKPVANYEGIYEVSNLGRVRSLDRVRVFTDGRVRRFPSVVLSGARHSHGYRSVRLADGPAIATHLIHRLVASAHCENPLGHFEVNHIDGDKTHNVAANLEWCSREENQRHASASGLFNPRRGTGSPFAKITDADVVRIREMAASGVAQKDISDIFGIAAPNISVIVSRKAWKHVA